MADLPENNGTSNDDDDWRRGCKYVYFRREVSYDDLRAEVEAEAAGLDPDQWIGGQFHFDDWLSDSLLVGTIKRLEEGVDGWGLDGIQ